MMTFFSLFASVIGMIVSVHLAIKIFLTRSQQLDTSEEEAQVGYDPYNMNNLNDDGMIGGERSNLIRRISPLAQLLRPTDTDELNELKQNLHYAGFRRPEALELYNAARMTSLLIAALLGGIILTTQGFDSGMVRLSAFILLIGFFIPKFWLKNKISVRQESIKLSLPPTLDLLVTCMEAGLNLEQAIDRVSKEINVSDPELADELQLVIQELNAGLSLSITFKKLANRVNSDDLKNLCNVIIQSATLGASLGRAMREYASGARRRRELKLEEDAGKVTARLTLPLTMCLLPSAMIAMLAPAIVTIVKSLSN